MGLRTLSKNRGSFPSDEALIKLFYLALRNISQKWSMPIRDWKAALTPFTIELETASPSTEVRTVYTKIRTRPDKHIDTKRALEAVSASQQEILI